MLNRCGIAHRGKLEAVTQKLQKELCILLAKTISAKPTFVGLHHRALSFEKCDSFIYRAAIVAQEPCNHY